MRGASHGITCRISGEDRRQHLASRSGDDPTFLRIALDQRLGKGLCLFKRDVRGQWWYFGVGLELDNDGSICAERLLPSRSNTRGIVNKDPLQAKQLSKFVVGDVGNALRSVEFCVALHDPLLPCDLVQILVVEDTADPAR